MDPSRFDRLSRALAAATTRRAALVALFGGLLSLDVSDEETEAKGSRSKHRRHRGGERDARDEQDRGRHQSNNRERADKQKKRKKQKRQQQEKKKKQEKKSRQRCPDGQSRCGASCVDTSSDAGNCGRCGAACAAGQRCHDGACTCNGEQCAGCCDGAACQDGRGDDQCGANGAACVPCTGGRTCQRGTCACPAGQDICNDACVDRQTDLDHCGECGHACGSGEICQGGACGAVCPAGGSSICVAGSATPDCCAGECTATATDPANCGACDAACDTVANGKAGCAEGKCGIEKCDTGFANCSGSDATGCETNTRTDRAHCGGCDNACPPGQECRDGGCTCGADGACGAGETCCDGVCRNLQTSFEACGGCGAGCDNQQADQCTGGKCTCGNGAACPDGRTCQGGSCSCPPGQDFCGDSCVDRQTDSLHCGQCDHACAQGEICLAGLCGVACGASDFCSSTSNQPDCCGETCTRTETDSGHCGVCGNACDSQLANRCVDSVCKCGSGGACAADQRCQDGTCTCNGEVCDGCCDGDACRDGSDNLLCGTNGEACKVCNGGRFCQNGECVCPEGKLFCDGNCVDRLTDESHCGACGRACEPNEVCQFGLCGVACGAGGFCSASGFEPTCCAGECVDTDTRTRHCGACGNDCTIQHASICFSGICRCGFTGAPCGADQTCCRSGDLNEAFCRDTETDMRHCGVCDRECGPGADRCHQGSCKCVNDPPCFEGLTCCGNQACFDLQNDSNHCGACWNVCQGGSLCINGACQCGSGDSCPTGKTCCGDGVCLDLQTDRYNCGSCGFSCNVDVGETCCDGTCRNIFFDIDHCGACGNFCPGDRQSENSDVVCPGGECVMTCRGQHYDMNFDVSDGCELEDTQENHLWETAKYLGGQGCGDGDVRRFTGVILSDTRIHDPEPPGFNPVENAAPVWHQVEFFSGEICDQFVVVNLRMEGGTSGCYRLTLLLSSTTHNYSRKVSATVIDGAASLSTGFFFYDLIHFKVEKTCGPPEFAAYEVTYHL